MLKITLQGTVLKLKKEDIVWSAKKTQTQLFLIELSF